MGDYNDPLDLLDDDGDGVVEMCLMEEEKQRKKGGNKNSSGCSVALFLVGSAVIFAGWIVI